MKRPPNYSLFTVTTASQSTAVWPKLKVNVRREHSVIKDFWQANEPAVQEKQRYMSLISFYCSKASLNCPFIVTMREDYTATTIAVVANTWQLHTALSTC